jgi:hypothetical protein
MTFSAWKSAVVPYPELQNLDPQSPLPLLLITKRSRSTQTAPSKLPRYQPLSLPATKRPLASQVFNLVQKLTTVRFSWTKRSELTLGLPLQLRLSYTAWIFKFRSPSFPVLFVPEIRSPAVASFTSNPPQLWTKYFQKGGSFSTPSILNIIKTYWLISFRRLHPPNAG